MKFVCISDTHNRHENLAFDGTEGDVLVHTGDFTDFGNLKKVKNFIGWFQEQPFPLKILIAGNHDVSLDENAIGAKSKIKEVIDRYVKNNENIIYLDESGHIIDGVKVWGSAYTFGGPTKWAFQYHNEKEAEERWSKIPEDTDILLTHGPPLGILDEYQGQKLGCPVLYKHVIERVRPAFHCFGHVHNQHGVKTKGSTVFINSAMVRDEWAGKDPITFTFDKRNPSGSTIY